MATNVRIDPELHRALKQASNDEGRPIGQIIADAFSQYKRAEFWKGVHEDYARLRADPEEWASWQRETELLDGGSLDSLADEDPYYTPEEIAEILASRG